MLLPGTTFFLGMKRFAVGLGGDRGRIASGFRADLLVLDVPNHRHVAHHHGANHVAAVVRAGAVV